MLGKVARLGTVFAAPIFIASCAVCAYLSLFPVGGAMAESARGRRVLLVLAMAVIALAFVQAAQAFDPPVATEGPLTARIQGPDAVKRTGEPLRVTVVLENGGKTEIKGTVRLQVIDRWKADPAGPQPFAAQAGGSDRVRFTVTADDGSFNGHYPIHAFAQFDADGKRMVAHPILVVETRLENPPRATFPLEWKPVTLHENSKIALWRLRLRKTAAEIIQSVAGTDLDEFYRSSRQARPPEQMLRPPVPGYEVTKRRPGAVVDDGTLASYPDEEMPWNEYLRVQNRTPFTRDNGPEGLAFELGGARYMSRSEFVPEPRNSDGLTWVHPPAMPGRVGRASVEYPLSLPEGGPIVLTFANAVEPVPGTAGAAAPSARPSVVFKVRVFPFDSGEESDGEVVFERSAAGMAWSEGDVDLSRYAGKTIRLRLEAAVPSGAAADTLAYWAEPAITCGSPAKQAPFPPAEPSGSRALGVIEAGGTRYEVRVWPGRRGLLDSAVGFVAPGRRLLFNGFRVQVAGDALEDLRSVSELVDVVDESSDGRCRVRHRFASLLGRFDVVGELWVEKGALRAAWRLENAPPPRPWSVVYLEDVSAGAWTDEARDVYLGHGYIIRQPGRFRLRFYGHTLPTSFVGIDFGAGLSMVQGLDAPPTDFESDPGKKFYTFHTAHAQTITFIPAQSVWQGARTWHDVNGLQAAGGVAKKAGRLTFDIWSGRYREGADALRRAFRYGLTDSLVVWHSWQRWGYDNRLPDIYPPDSRRGTLEEFRELVGVCKDNRTLFAPHDNYIDFYPDAEGFSYDNMAFSSERQVEWGWYNSGPQAQSYHPRADRLGPFVQRNLKLVKEGFAPTAYFIDVWANERPYDYWSSDGRFFDALSTREAWGETFAFIRDTLGGDAPTIGEAGNDQLIGWLDGADCQFNRIDNEVPVPRADIERVPWFDAAHHDRFILHGVGYPERYASGKDRRIHGIYSDDYLSAEVLTGHAPMVRHLFGRDPVAKHWLLNDLARALALRRIEGVEFAEGNIHRQTVRWGSGGEVRVNRGPEDWRLGERLLPEYGFYASVPVEGGKAEAAIEKRDGVIVEWSSSPGLVYVNARPPILDKNSPVGREYGGRAGDAGPDPRLARMNPDSKVISFGAAATNGAFRLASDAGGLTLVPLPYSTEFVARLRWRQLPWKVPEPTRAEATGEDGKPVKSVPVKKEGDEIVLTCEPDVFAYRLR